MRRGRGGDRLLAELTPREQETLALMAEGRSNAGIAEHLVVTERAVEKHVTSIFDKLQLDHGSGDHRRVLAVLRYMTQPGTRRQKAPARARPGSSRAG